MAARNSSSSYKFKTLVTLLYRYRIISGGSRQSRQASHWNRLQDGLGYRGPMDRGLRFMSPTSRAYSQPTLGTENDQKVEQAQEQPSSSPANPKFGFPNWLKWLLGSVVSFLLPFWKNKWDSLLRLEGTAEKVVQEVEVVVEAVEAVAATADKALAEVANQLPDNSKLKEAAQAMEHVSSVVCQDAELIDNVIHKVGDVKQDLEELETMVEPIVDKIIRAEHQKASTR